MNKRSSGFGPSLIELIVAVTVFSVISAICIKIFVDSKSVSADSAALSRAIIIAQSAAESFKATADCGETALLLEGEETTDGFIIYLDGDMSPADRASSKYSLTGTVRENDGPAICDIIVYSESGEEIFSIAAAGRAAE